MTLIPKAPPAAEAFATVDETREQLELPDESRDEDLARLLRRVNRAFMSPAGLGRNPFRASVQWLLRPRGGCFLRPPLWPVESVGSFRELAGDEFPLEELQVLDGSPAPGDRRRRLYLPGGWPCPAPEAGTATPTHRLDFTAGWLSAGEVREWSTSLAVEAGDWVRPTEAHLLRFRAETGGAPASTEPSWPSAVGETVTDGAVTWLGLPTVELPEDLTTAALLTAESWWRGDLSRAEGLRTFRAEEAMASFHANSPPRAIPRAAEAMLRWYQ